MRKEKTNDLDKYSVTYEDEISISIWKYDKKKSSKGPVEVEHKWKKGFDPWSANKKTVKFTKIKRSS